MQTDVLVIGGGATGGGIAWDLALRGLRVTLAEMGDLATGTSGRYHGLLHSGGRYAVRDPESAKECIDENLILRRIAPEAIEDTGGYFVLCPGDDESYVDAWLKGCADAGIPTREVPLTEARRRENALNPLLRAVYEVPDGTCDSWDLLHALQRGAEATGRARFLTYQRVEDFYRSGDRITGARLVNLRDGQTLDIECLMVVNAAGPWAAQIAEKAGVRFGMKLSRGAMLAYNIRWVNTVINKLRKPGDGDIFVPVGTVSVIGTTSVRTDDPGDVRVEAWEVARILDEAEAMTPGISRARILRAWGGVRPLYDPGQSADGREAKRTFALLDHAERDGLDGLLSIVGGKLTTFRQMAEKVVDLVCARLNVSAPCITAETPLPSTHGGEARLHHLGGRLDRLEDGQTPGALICECELVTAPQITHALDEGVFTLNDLRRDLRLGMGPCQGGFCAYRAAALRHEHLHDTPDHTRALLAEFAERRFGGMRPLLWGHNLRQALLAESIYGRILGLTSGETAQTVPDWSNARLPKPDGTAKPRVIVVGAGLAGLMAALAAAESGARVELVAQGQGALTLHPGWIETGDVSTLAEYASHPYAAASSELALGLALLDRVVPLESSLIGGAPIQAVTGIGAFRPVAFAQRDAIHTLTPGSRVLVVGIDGWRDFYAGLAADALRTAGYDAASLYVRLPHRGGSFDDWPLDFANQLDTTAGLKTLAAQVKPALGRATTAAFPAILGFQPETRQKLAEALGCPVIEIPTLPPSVPGLRLYHALRRALLERGVRFTIGPRIGALTWDNGRVTGVLAETAANGRARHLPADAVILATGGLFGGGLESDYTGAIREPLTGMTLDAPPRDEWFAHPLLGGAAQPIHAVGLRTDREMRPLTLDGTPIAPNLYAAGRILGGYSPIIEGCTEGVDIATGTRAALCAVMSSQFTVYSAS